MCSSGCIHSLPRWVQPSNRLGGGAPAEARQIRMADAKARPSATSKFRRVLSADAKLRQLTNRVEERGSDVRFDLELGKLVAAGAAAIDDRDRQAGLLRKPHK